MYAAAKSMCLHSRIKDLLNHLGTRFLFFCFLFFVFCFFLRGLINSLEILKLDSQKSHTNLTQMTYSRNELKRFEILGIALLTKSRISREPPFSRRVPPAGIPRISFGVIESSASSCLAFVSTSSTEK